MQGIVSVSLHYRLYLTLAHHRCAYSQWLACLRSGPQQLRLEILVTTQPTQPENNDTQVTVVGDSSAHNSPTNAGVTEIPASMQIQDTPKSELTAEDAAPSFTALIEEFRQREERMAPQGLINHVPATDHNEQSAAQAETAPAQEGFTHMETPEPQSGARDTTPAAPTTKPERPVSPLLRPA